MAWNFQYGPYTIDLHHPIDLSWPVRRSGSPIAFGLPTPQFEVFETEGFRGSVREGGTCNVEILHLVPHGNGTHTECWGHIHPEPFYISEVRAPWLFIGVVWSFDVPFDRPVEMRHLSPKFCQAIEMPHVRGAGINVVNLPSPPVNFTGRRPPFLSAEVAAYLGKHLNHLITNLPSIDSEHSKTLSAHRAFLGVNPSTHTITELAAFPNELPDGLYWTALMVPVIETDAVPSRPILYPLTDSDTK